MNLSTDNFVILGVRKSGGFRAHSLFANVK